MTTSSHTLNKDNAKWTTLGDDTLGKALCDRLLRTVFNIPKPNINWQKNYSDSDASFMHESHNIRVECKVSRVGVQVTLTKNLLPNVSFPWA